MEFNYPSVNDRQQHWNNFNFGPDIKLIAYFHLELLVAIRNSNNINDSVHQYLNEYFKNVKLNESFNKKLVIVYEEKLFIDIFLGIHTWFSRQCCNLSNIVFVSATTINLSVWYKEYVETFNQRGMTVIDAPLSGVLFDKLMTSVTGLKVDTIKKDLKYYFSYFGGQELGWVEQDFLAALFLTRKNIGLVDYLAGFQCDAHTFESYLENITGYSNRSWVDQLLDSRKTSPFKLSRIKMTAGSDPNNTKQFQEQTAIQVLRENVNSQPFVSLTGTTIKSFLYFDHVMPLGIRSVESLEQLGFKFDHELIAYDYQYEPMFFNRMLKVIEQLDRIKNRFTLDELEKRLYTNTDILRHNHDHIVSGNMLRLVKEKLAKELNK